MATAMAKKLPIPRLKAKEYSSRKRTAVACVACRIRRIKCDGLKPRCWRCSQLDIGCEWPLSKSRQKQSELETANAKIHAYESLLEELVSNTGRTSPLPIDEVFSKHLKSHPNILSSVLGSSIRASLPDILRPLDQKDHRSTSPPPPFHRPSRLATSNIQRWTSLIDNETASHLLSLYFSWESPIFNLIDLSAFLDDLESGCRRFCSSLLVHVLLFFGTNISNTQLQLTDWRPEKLLNRNLYSEIQRLWKQEKNNKTLPTAQSSILIGQLFCTFGLDRIGTKYILYGADICRQLDLHLKSPSYFSSTDSLKACRLSTYHITLSWAVFDIQILTAQLYGKAPLWPHPPSISFNYTDCSSSGTHRSWNPDPFVDPSLQPHYYTTSRICHDLIAIAHEVVVLQSNSSDSETHWNSGVQLYRKLICWRTSLPTDSPPGGDTSPHILCMHLRFQATLIQLCDIFADHPGTEDFNPCLSRSQAMDEVGSLLLIFNQTHGWKPVSIVMLHYLCLAGVHSISQLQSGNSRWSSILECCVDGLWHMSLGWGRACTALLRVIQLLLQSANLDDTFVPPKVVSIFNQFDRGRWTATDIASLAADYIVHGVPADGGSLADSASAQPKLKATGLEKLIRTLDVQSPNS